MRAMVRRGAGWARRARRGRRARWGRIGRAGGVVAVALTLALPTAAAAGPEAAGSTAGPLAQGVLRTAEDSSPGLRVEETVTYAPDLAASVIHVTHVVTLTNQVPDEVTSTYVREFYFPEFTVAILRHATGVAARRDGHGSLRVRTEPWNEHFDTAVVDLAPDLQYRQTQTIVVTYALPERPPRSDAVAQVNEAFATFPVFTSADPGLGTVTVTVPSGPDVVVEGSPMTASTSGDVVVHTATGIADPATWFATVLVRDDDALVSRDVDFGNGVRVQAWPGDTEWLDFTSDLAERGLPTLESVLGLPWPVATRLDIVETVAPYVYGYAGWFDQSTGLIEVGDALDAHVVLHEMAHAWLHGGLLDGRWMYEALADEFAALAMAELGTEPPAPDPPDTAAPGALPLNDWTTPELGADDAADTEAYGYNASWWVARSLADEIGAEGLGAVVQDAAAHRSPYPAGTTTSTLAGTTDWRTFLDLLEEVGGSTGAEQLFRDLVVTPDDLPLLDARAEARAAYGELVADLGGWAPPAYVRDPMAAWSFDEAVTAIADTGRLVERVDAVADTLAGVDETLSEDVQRMFESTGGAGSLRSLVGGLEEASAALVEATTAVDGANPFARLGMVVVDAGSDVDAARAALRDARLREATEAAGRAVDRLSTATLLGGGAAGALVLLVVVVVLVVRARRRHRRRATVPAVPATGVMGTVPTMGVAPPVSVAPIGASGAAPPPVPAAPARLGPPPPPPEAGPPPPPAG